MFLMAQSVGRAMRKHCRGGSIINIASVLGLCQAGAVLPYAVSKAGAIQMTKVLALEWARFGIRVNALAPVISIPNSITKSVKATQEGDDPPDTAAQIGRTRRFGWPLLLLASEASAYINGSVPAVDGGHLVSSL
jgi:hypothetical protein